MDPPVSPGRDPILIVVGPTVVPPWVETFTLDATRMVLLPASSARVPESPGVGLVVNRVGVGVGPAVRAGFMGLMGWLVP